MPHCFLSVLAEPGELWTCKEPADPREPGELWTWKEPADTKEPYNHEHVKNQ